VGWASRWRVDFVENLYAPDWAVLIKVLNSAHGGKEQGQHAYDLYEASQEENHDLAE